MAPLVILALPVGLRPSVNRTARRVTGDGTFTGTTRADGPIFIATSEAATWLNYSEQQESGTRTVTFGWRRPT